MATGQEKYPAWKKSEWATPGAVHTAATNNDAALLKALAACDAVLDKPNDIGWTPLMYAVHNGAKEAVAVLLEAGVNPDQGKYGDGDDTPLMLAAESGRTDLMEMLIAAGANPDKTNSYGVTALMTAAHWREAEAARLLLENGAKPNIQDKEGDTALTIVADNSGDKVALVLLQKGADPSIKNKKGQTAQMLAEKRSHFHDGARMILKHLKGSSREMKQRSLRGYLRRNGPSN